MCKSSVVDYNYLTTIQIRLQLSNYQITIIKDLTEIPTNIKSSHQYSAIKAFGEQGSGLTSSMYECVFVSLLFSKVFQE